MNSLIISRQRLGKLWARVYAPGSAACPVQEAGLKVKEYELLRKNFSDTGNFGKQRSKRQQHRCRRQRRSACTARVAVQVATWVRAVFAWCRLRHPGAH